MARRIAPDFPTTRALLVHPGNQCAFSGCERPLTNYKGQRVGEICHIEAASPGGERFNAAMSDRDRGQAENLLLLCREHHVETNDVVEFPVARMREIKAEHEKQFSGPPSVSEEVLERAVQDIIAASIEDLTDRVVLRMPQTLEAFSTTMEYHETSEERLVSLKAIEPRLQALRHIPVDTRAMFAILVDRVDVDEKIELPLRPAHIARAAPHADPPGPTPCVRRG